MPPFEQTVRAPQVDEASRELAASLATTFERDILQRVAAETNRLQDRIKLISQEKLQLEQENNRLRQENAALKRGAAAAAAKAPPAVPQPGAAAPPPGLRSDDGAGAGAAAGGPEMFRLVKAEMLHQAPVHSVAMDKYKHPNKRIATAAWDGSVKIYDLGAGNVVRTLGGPNSTHRMDGLYAVAFAKTDPGMIGCTSRDTNVYIWDAEVGHPLKKLSGHKDEVNGIDFHDFQTVICTASDDKSVIIWDFKEGMNLRELNKHDAEVYGCKFLGQEHQYFVASCSFDQKIRIWDMRDKNIVKTLTNCHSKDIIGIDYWSDGRALATGSDDGTVAIWDSRMDWQLRKKYHATQDSEVKRVAFCPEKGLLAAACSTGMVLVFDMKDAAGDRPIATLGGHTDCVFDIAWGTDPTTDAPILVSASHDHMIRHWVGVQGAFD